jgi:hypothetical protein
MKPEAKNDCAGEVQQQFNGPTDFQFSSVSLHSSARVCGWRWLVISLQGRELESRGTSAVESRYRAT